MENLAHSVRPFTSKETMCKYSSVIHQDAMSLDEPFYPRESTQPSDTD